MSHPYISKQLFFITESSMDFLANFSEELVLSSVLHYVNLLMSRGLHLNGALTCAICSHPTLVQASFN